MNSRRLPKLLCTFAIVSAACAANADVKLHGLFTDHMVLQRDAEVPVWGWADDGEKVTVEFRGQKASATAERGKWMVRLKKLKPGQPDQLKVTGKNSITLQDVQVGEIWIASGQSNMEWTMRDSFEPASEIPKVTNSLVRFYTVSKRKADQPVDNVTNAWQVASPENAPRFSAVAWYFARDLQQALGVPVGIIHTSWGGSPCEVWMRDGVLADNPAYKRDILDTYTAALAKAQADIAAWDKEKALAESSGAAFTKRRPGLPFWKPGELYNGMIAPLIPCAIRGAIWYQGESNAERAYQYRTLMADMISNWRRDWDQSDFTFLQVQLAPFKAYKPEPAVSSWAELREAQNHVANVLPNVAVAVITDVGDEKDIHPKKKEPAGARLALAARRIAYGEKIIHSGPVYRDIKIRRGEAILSFDYVGGGLEGRPIPGRTNALVFNVDSGHVEGALTGFAICGKDRKFLWGNARIEGDKVIVSHKEVRDPVAVRYGWADFPVVNLWNKDGLPASPFRTDDFPMITAPKPAQEKK